MEENIAKFCSEAEMLKRIKTEGMRLAGVDQPHSIAEHMLVAAQLAFILAELEGADSYKCAAILVFHDNAETRIGDQNKVTARYLRKDNVELLALQEQVANLPEAVSKRIEELFLEIEKRQSKEGIIAKDADWLETAIQAKIYLEQGYRGCQNWIDNVEKALETDSAKKILTQIKEMNDFTNSWWQGLKKMTYEKLDQEP
jgi:putative hydrolase of HD superfamily